MMRLRFNNSPHAWWRLWRPLTAAVVALGLGAMATGCSDDGPAPADEALTVKLKINVAAVEPAGEGSRADDTEFEHTDYVNEMMNSLRIIIIHDDPSQEAKEGEPVRKVVEFNQFWDLRGESLADGTPLKESVNKEINVYAGKKSTADDKKAGDKKEIYIIANEHSHYSGMEHVAAEVSAGDDLLLSGIDLSNDTYGSGAVLDDDAIKALEALTFTYDPERDIKGLVPMAEHHSVFVRAPKNDAQGNIVDREQAVSIFLTRALVKVTVNVVNASSAPLELTGYRLTNMAKTGYLFPYNTVYSPAKADCQQEGKDLKDREITSFVIPAQQLYIFERTFTDAHYVIPANDKDSDGNYKPLTLPSVYIPESQASAGFGIDLSLFGGYQVAPQPLTDLAGKLPRNTHLYIEATVRDIGVSFEAWVQPYREVNLRPGFGLPKK